MTRRQQYKIFLKSPFWRNLSAEKRRLVPKCQKCKRKRFLQAHHTFYRDDWFQTKLEDLKVLCRRCHRKEHGLTVRGENFMIHRDDYTFSVIMHRCHCLISRMSKGGIPLRPRDEAFLFNAVRLYPPTESDTCMKFHVEQVFGWDKLSRTGVLKC